MALSFPRCAISRGWRPFPGGSPFNIALAVARLGVSAGFLSRLSRDLFGDQLMAAMQDNKVDTALVRRSETESVGRQSARKILTILGAPPGDLDDADYRHMKKVIGYCRRHLAQRPWGDISDTRWRWSLMNWGHDPLRGRNSYDPAG